jgi:hypothetical protein
MGSASLQLFRHSFEVPEERRNKGVQLLARCCQFKRAALKQGHTQKFFELNDLRADCRLLDAVWHIAHGFGNSPASRDVIEELEVMDVHDGCHASSLVPCFEVPRLVPARAVLGGWGGLFYPQVLQKNISHGADGASCNSKTGGEGHSCPDSIHDALKLGTFPGLGRGVANVMREKRNKKEEIPMTMAPGKKRSFWLEILFVGILLFLLRGALSQQGQRSADAVKGLSGVGAHRTFLSSSTHLK